MKNLTVVIMVLSLMAGCTSEKNIALEKQRWENTKEVPSDELFKMSMECVKAGGKPEEKYTWFRYGFSSKITGLRCDAARTTADSIDGAVGTATGVYVGGKVLDYMLK